MPVSIVSSILLYSVLFLPGARIEGSQPARAEMAHVDQHRTQTMLAWPLDASDEWLWSEANVEEEDTSDGDGELIVFTGRWYATQTGLSRQASAAPSSLIAFRPSLRSPILRC